MERIFYKDETKDIRGKRLTPEEVFCVHYTCGYDDDGISYFCWCGLPEDERPGDNIVESCRRQYDGRHLLCPKYLACKILRCEKHDFEYCDAKDNDGSGDDCVVCMRDRVRAYWKERGCNYPPPEEEYEKGT